MMLRSNALFLVHVVMNVCVCVCVQPVRVRACWSAGTVSVFRQRSVVTARTTVRTAATRSTAAESRVRHLSVWHTSLESSSLLLIIPLCVFQLRVCASPVSPAVSPLPVRQRAGGATPPATPETTTTTAVSRHSVLATTDERDNDSKCAVYFIIMIIIIIHRNIYSNTLLYFIFYILLLHYFYF